MGHKSALVVLVTVPVVVMGISAVGAVWQPANRGQYLSAIAASTSALAAVIAALWIARREAENRDRSRKESAQNEFSARKKQAVIFGKSMTAWCDRKDVHDLLDDLSRTGSKEFIEAGLKSASAAITPAANLNDESTLDPWHAETSFIERALRRNVFQHLLAIPGPCNDFQWESEVDLVGVDSQFFRNLDTIWINLQQSVKQFDHSFLALRGVSNKELNFLRRLAFMISDEATALKTSVVEFHKLVRTAGTALSAYTEKGVSEPLRASALLENSWRNKRELSDPEHLSYLRRKTALESALRGIERSIADLRAIQKGWEQFGTTAPDQAGTVPENPP
jgi:hypothetical protein